MKDYAAFQNFTRYLVFRALRSIQITAQEYIQVNDDVSSEIDNLSRRGVLVMTNIYDIVSGKWQCEPSIRVEDAPQYTYPPTAVETSALQLQKHTEAVPYSSSMPHDLADVTVSSFLKRQATPI